MEVRKDFGKRLAASCKGIPPESIGMLIKAILPKTIPISTKAPAPRAAALSDLLPMPHMKAPSAKAPAKKLKTRGARVLRWNILKVNAHIGHSPKSHRHWMAKAATWCATAPTGPRYANGAQNLLNEWGHGDVKMDIPWLVRKGYIELVEGEE